MLASLEALRARGFAGAEALQRAVVAPLRAAVAECVADGARATQPSDDVLAMTDLEALPCAVLARLASLCAIQARVLACPPRPRAEGTRAQQQEDEASESASLEEEDDNDDDDDQWRLTEEAGGGGDGDDAALEPTEALLRHFCADGGGADALLAWVRGADAARAAYAPARALAAALRTLPASGAPAAAADMAARGMALLLEARKLAAERCELAAAGAAAAAAHARLRAAHAAADPAVPRDLAAACACARSARALLQWEEALCAALAAQQDAEKLLHTRRAALVNDACSAATGAQEDAKRRLIAARARGDAGAAAEAHDVLEDCLHDFLDAMQRTVETVSASETARVAREALERWRALISTTLATLDADEEAGRRALATLAAAASAEAGAASSFHTDAHYAELDAALPALAVDCAAAVAQLAAVAWRLGEQVLALSCDDGDAFIGAHLARPLLLRRLADAAAGAVRHAANRAADAAAAALLAEEEAEEEAEATRAKRGGGASRRKAARRRAGAAAPAEADAAPPDNAAAPLLTGIDAAADDGGAAAATAADAAAAGASAASQLADDAEGALLAAVAQDDATALADALATHGGACGDVALLRDATVALERLLLAQDAAGADAVQHAAAVQAAAAPPPPPPQEQQLQQPVVALPPPLPPPAAAAVPVQPPPVQLPLQLPPAAAPPPPPEEPADDVVCVVCLCERKSCVLLPCRHLCACDGCAAALAAAPPARALCPVCRAPIQGTFSVFV
jgi:hypothetical protein